MLGTEILKNMIEGHAEHGDVVNTQCETYGHVYFVSVVYFNGQPCTTTLWLSQFFGVKNNVFCKKKNIALWAKNGGHDDDSH